MKHFDFFYEHLVQFALFNGNLVNVVAIRYITPILVFFIKKNLATLFQNRRNRAEFSITKNRGLEVTPPPLEFE
jgi:hypothetical protein